MKIEAWENWSVQMPCKGGGVVRRFERLPHSALPDVSFPEAVAGLQWLEQDAEGNYVVRASVMVISEAAWSREVAISAALDGFRARCDRTD